MPAKTFTQLTNIDEQNIDNANDVFAVWDNAHATDSPQAKQLKAKNVLTSPDTSVSLQTSPAVSTTGNVSRVVCVDQTGYNNLSPKDSNTLYVITDGKTKDSYVGQIDTLAAKTYYIDIQPIADYEIYSVFLNGTDAGSTGTIALQINGVTQNIEGAGVSGEFSFDAGTPDTLPFGGTSLPLATTLTGTAGQSISLVVTGTPAVTDFTFVVEYGV